MNQHTAEIERRQAFWSRVDRKSDNACWSWLGGHGEGYGATSYHGRTVGAHRLAWIFSCGPIPPGKWVLHKCDVRLCVNPSHLYLGNHADNTRDAVERGRMAFGERAGRPKLDDGKVARMRWLFERGSTNTELARRFHVSRKIVMRIRQGRAWKHVAKIESALAAKGA